MAATRSGDGQGGSGVLMKRRLPYLLLALLCFVLCFVIATRLVDLRFIRGFVGDWLVVLLIYFLIKGLWDIRPRSLAIGVFLFACSIEGLQYLHAADRLGLARGSWPRIILGTTFDPLDILAYLLGALTACGIDVCIAGRRDL